MTTNVLTANVRSLETKARERREGVPSSLPCTRSEVSTPRKGDEVVAEDGYLGRIDELILTETRKLAFIIVKSGPIWRRRRPVIARDLLTFVSRQQRRVHVAGGRGTLARLSEALPIVI